MASKKITYTLCKASLIAFTGFGLLLGAAPSAHAGFQWRPAPALEQEVPHALSETIIEKSVRPLEPLPILQHQDMAEPDDMITKEPKIQILRMPEQNDVKSMSAAPLEQVVGFGTDMPLALALRQIVPADYAFSFGMDVNPGYRVSWNGGQPWDLIVAEMIAPLDFIPVINGKVVHIIKIGAPAEVKEVPLSEALLTPPVELSRSNIVDPGQVAQKQRPEAMSHIQQLVETQTIQEPVDLMESDMTGLLPIGEGVTTTNEELSLSAPPQNFKSFPELEKEQETDAFAIKQFWEAQKGDSLRNTLIRWSAQTDTMLVWDATKDYTLTEQVFVNDTFTNALKIIFTITSAEDEGPALHLIKGNEDNKSKLVIRDMG